jgi:hypothetical protein
MAADTVPRRPVAPVLAGTLAATALVAGGIAMAVLGVNPALGTMMSAPLVLLRQVFPLLLALGAVAVALSFARPGAADNRWQLLLFVAPVLAAAVVLRELALVPPTDWGRAALGRTSASCLTSLTLIGLPLLAGGLWALSRGASTRPATSGALAGLLAWAIAAAIYALHCTEPSPLFYAAWYGLALIGITAIGAALGSRLLRW